MGTTSNFDLPYPETNAAPTVPLHMRQLAEATDSVLETIDTRSTLETQTVTPASGVVAANTEGVRLKRKNGVVYLTAEIKPAAGQTIATNATLFTIPSGWRPLTRVSAGAMIGGQNAGAVAHIETSGTVRMPFANVAADVPVFISDAWPVS